MMISQHILPNVMGRYRYDAELSKMCWFGVGGKADVLFIPLDSDDLSHFLSNIDSSIPITLLGVGSNILIRDGGIRGVVIRLGQGFNYIRHSETLVCAGASMLDFNVAQYCGENSIAGLEFLAGIPGTVGGALHMNAGAYGSDVASVLVEAKAMKYNGDIVILSPSLIDYKYRGYNIKEKYIFIEGVFSGALGIREDILNSIKHIQDTRVLTQPIRSKTGGSTFKNPEGISAWKLIDQANCRGLKIGGAIVSEKHCNFFINDGNATACDIENLIIEVQERVMKFTGVMLEPEIKIIGEK